MDELELFKPQQCVLSVNKIKKLALISPSRHMPTLR